MGEVLQKNVHGHLVFYDSEKTHRWYDVIGPEAVKFNEHWAIGPIGTDNPGGWTITLVEAGGGESTVTSTDVAGGALLLTADAAENDGITMQLGGPTNGESVKLNGVFPFYIGARLQINDVDQTDFFLGLCITDTTILGGATDSIGFRSVDASATVYSLVEKDSNETTTALADMTDATDCILEMYCDGLNIYFYMDGTLYDTVSMAATDIPDDEELRLSVEFLTGEATANTMQIDWLRMFYIHA